MKSKCFFILFFSLSFFLGFAQSQPTQQLSFSAGWAGVSNSFYSVNTVADMHFDQVSGARIDFGYGFSISEKFRFFGGMGMIRHTQNIRINRHHFNPAIPLTENNYIDEISTRNYFNFIVGVTYLLPKSKESRRWQFAIPLGTQNMLGYTRTIQTDNDFPENINFKSWFFGVYTGLEVDYQLNEKTSLRFSPTFTQFFTQYPHYTGSQYSFDVSVGVVFGL